MNFKTVKTVFFKETKESLKDNKFLLSTLLNIAIMTAMAFLVMNYEKGSLLGEAISIGYMVMLPAFSMWILSVPFIQEKFWNEKMVKGFQPLLTLPITIKDIWLGKIFAMFALSYPSTLLIAIILGIIYSFLNGINAFTSFSISLWIAILILGPLAVVTYDVIASWIALNFDNPRINDILQYCCIGGAILGFLSLTKLSELLQNYHINDFILVILGLIILGFILSSITYLVNHLDKEKVLI